MNVQTFLRPEVSELITEPDKLSEWSKISEDLGLLGQKKIQSKEKSPNPFLAVNQGLEAALRVLCPLNTSMENYSFDAIPLEALKMISLAKAENYFKRIEIWWDDKAVDPVAIGLTGDWLAYGKNCETTKHETEELAKAHAATIAGGWTCLSKSGMYLIARWGAEACSISTLIENAKARYIKQQSAEANRKIREGKLTLDTIEHEAVERFG